MQVVFIRSPARGGGAPTLQVHTANHRVGENETLVLAGPTDAAEALASL